MVASVWTLQAFPLMISMCAVVQATNDHSQHDSLVSLTQNLMFEIHGEIIKCGPGNDHYDYQGDIRAPTEGLLEVMHLSTMQQL